MKNLIQRNGVYYYRQTTPRDIRAVFGKREYAVSLKTKDRNIAAERFAAENRKCEAIFHSYRIDPRQPERDRLAALQSISEASGRTYVSAASKSELSNKELLVDAHAVAEEWQKQGKPIDARFDANFGSIEEKVTLSDTFDFFVKHNLAKQNEMSQTEYRKWINPRKLWINNFINDQGDLAIEDITPKVVYDFKQNYLQERINTGEISSATASKCGSYLKTIFNCRNEELQLGLTNPFETLRFSRVGEKRATISREQIQDKLLSKGYLDGLNDQARALLLIMVNTGCGPKEVVGLQAEDIVLDSNIPHIVIRPNKIRQLKNEHRTRTIPILGVALEELRKFKDGFPRYGTDAGAEKLSACLNKFLGDQEYFEPKQTVYSHRHGFKDRMRNAGFTDSLMDDLMGHAGKGPRYGEGYSLEVKAEKLISVSL